MMRRELLELLACPRCNGGLEIGSGLLRCKACGAAYSSFDGMPILFPNGQPAETATAAAFAKQWSLQSEGAYEQATIYGETSEQELQSFLDRFGLAAPAALAGRAVLDVGCGSGRLTQSLAMCAPEALVVGIDFSGSARLAFQRCRDATNALVVQSDLHHPPFVRGAFDFVYADGVLPHVPEPEAALAALDRVVRPGGRLFVWIYPRSWSPYRWMRDLLPVVRRMPVGAQRALEKVLGVPLWAAFKLYEPGRGARRRSLDEVLFMLHDHLAPEYQHRCTPDELAAAFARLGYQDLRHLRPDTGVAGTKPG
jgi:SAM-dependent methyltransferase